MLLLMDVRSFKFTVCVLLFHCLGFLGRWLSQLCKSVGECDGLDWVSPHNSPNGAGASHDDPEVIGNPTNPGAVRRSRQEDGSSRSPASGCQRREANKEKNGGVDEDVSGRIGETKEQYVPIGDGKTAETKEPYVPIGDERSGENRTSVIPIGDRRTRLREAECGSPPRFWRSVAYSGAWK
ncbi:hypothetical protein NDU88_003946 [Pleurodeles waltl]|uniref:Secreted protein n=1 Tax=Pleurodeles waltl TaxID=8319 RepID=A0AAV7KWE6_PLEWA|nr:hypothetical protein NDU88_003946 [Pleurodeles waltl]